MTVALALRVTLFVSRSKAYLNRSRQTVFAAGKYDSTRGKEMWSVAQPLFRLGLRSKR